MQTHRLTGTADYAGRDPLADQKSLRQKRQPARGAAGRVLVAWLGSAILWGGLLWLDVRVGILAGLAGGVAVWLRQQRVPKAPMAETHFYHRTLAPRPASAPTRPADPVSPVP